MCCAPLSLHVEMCVSGAAIGGNTLTDTENGIRNIHIVSRTLLRTPKNMTQIKLLMTFHTFLLFGNHTNVCVRFEAIRTKAKNVIIT